MDGGEKICKTQGEGATKSRPTQTRRPANQLVKMAKEKRPTYKAGTQMKTQCSSRPKEADKSTPK